MKVKDLIEELKKFPEDLDVVGMWNDLEYGWDISQSVDVYTTTVKNTNGIYSLTPTFRYNKELPWSDIEVLVVCV